MYHLERCSQSVKKECLCRTQEGWGSVETSTCVLGGRPPSGHGSGTDSLSYSAPEGWDFATSSEAVGKHTL